MNCYTSSIIGLGMLGATYSTMSVTKEQKEKLKKTLSPELQERYEKIVAERRDHYFQGLVIGLIVSYFMLRLLNITNIFHRVTFFLAITIPTSVLYYSLMPKSDYMLNHLKTPEQNKAWLEVYNTMKHSYLYGFAFGSLSAIPLAFVLC